MEDAVAQDAGIVDHRIDAPEVVEGGLHDLARRAPASDRLRADFSYTAPLFDQRLGLLGGRGGPTLTGQRRADICDDEPRARIRHHDGFPGRRHRRLQ
jgi:hypothetical protein